ncbi:MAG: methyl-accepting chemotaxis protein [Roseburia sp.]
MKKTKKNQEKASIFRSVKGKLVILGLVSIATTVILGITGISVLNSNNSNNQVLADINNVNLIQNENSTLETAFLYDLDLSHYTAIQTNLAAMKQNSEDSLKHAGLNFHDDLLAIDTDLTTLSENMTSLTSYLTERSFDSSSGMYAKYLESDAGLSEAFQMMAGESEWIDGVWSEVPLEDVDSVSVDGTNYRKFSYETEIVASGKRNYLIVRAGNNGILYTGNVYITNIRFDDSTSVDISAFSTDDLSRSYGEGFSDLAVSSFNGEACITFKGNYSDENPNWQETSIEIPIPTYPMETSRKLSYDIYFEETTLPVIKLAVAFNEKYDFSGNLGTANSIFQNYNKLIAEGTDAADLATELTAKLEEIKNNISAYTINEEAISKGTEAINAKEEALQSILSYDTEILSLKKENNTLNETLTAAISAVRTDIEKNTEANRTSMFAMITIVFLVGTVLVILLTIFVITSVQKSIQGFRGTLKNISEGHLSVKAKTGSGDEFDIFGRSLNQMTDKLTDVLGSVATIASEVQESGGNLENMAQSTNETSLQMDTSVSEIAKGASSQAEDVDQSTQQITKLGALMDTMVNHVAELDDTSANMKNASDEAVSILNELSSSNERMTDGIHNIAEQIARTNDSVKKIGDAVSLISSIASQTNLLSLNASIEAARAGEAGRGFAVVASEIQQLADQSNNSANTIYQVISALTSDFQTTLQIMQEVEEATITQNEKLSETQKQFEIVNSGIAQSRDKTSIMKESIDECNELRLNVSHIMTNLSAISAENAAATSETAESMQVLNRTISELLNESKKLLDISSNLEKDMQFFDLN